MLSNLLAVASATRGGCRSLTENNPRSSSLTEFARRVIVHCMDSTCAICGRPLIEGMTATMAGTDRLVYCGRRSCNDKWLHQADARCWADEVPAEVVMRTMADVRAFEARQQAGIPEVFVPKFKTRDERRAWRDAWRRDHPDEPVPQGQGTILPYRGKLRRTASASGYR